MARFTRQLMGQDEVKMDLSGSESITGSQGGILMMGSGSDGTAKFVKINAAGELVTTAGGIVTASVDVTGNVDQGLSGSIGQSWYMSITDGTQVIGTGSSAPLWVSGTVSVQGQRVTQSVIFPPAPTSTRTSITASKYSTQVVAENAGRKGLMLYVSSSETDIACYLGFGSAVSFTDASFILYGDDAYTLENTFIAAPMQAIFNQHSGSTRLYITEIT